MNLFEMPLVDKDGKEVYKAQVVSYVDRADTHIVVTDRLPGIGTLSKPKVLGLLAAEVRSRMPRVASIWIVRLPEGPWSWQPLLEDTDPPRLGPAQDTPTWFRSHLPSAD